MEYRQLGRTGLQVSRLCLGCMMFGGKTAPEDSYAIIDKALDEGINFLDTANVYSRGRSEEVTGEALKRNGKRPNTVLATKVHGPMSDDDPNMRGNHRRNIIQACDASLKRLQTEWIDLYQIHRPQSEIPVDEMLRALDDLVRSGKIRYFGTSTYSAWQSVEALWVSERYGLNRIVTEQPPYNILDRRIERELLPMARTFGYGIIPWSPLAGGLLTGKYQRGSDPEGGRYSGEINEWMKGRKTDAIYDVVDGLKSISDKHGATLAQVALSWVRDRPGVTSPIIGPRTMAQLDDNLDSESVVLDESDLSAIDGLVPPGEGVSSFYEADFGPHPYRV